MNFNDKLSKLLAEQPSQKLTTEQKLQNTKKWTDFYRKNIDIYVEDYLGINIHQFQKNMLTTIQDNDISVLVCSRGSSKSFCTAIAAVAYATLYSNCNILVVSLTLAQSNLILQAKIEKELSDPRSGLSPMLRQMRQDGYLTFKKDPNTGGVIAEFGNGSKIFSCVLGESMRGNRGQIVILDEAAICSKTLYQQVAEPTLTQRVFAGRPSDYVEEPKQILLSSSKTKTNWLWRYLVNCVNGHYKGGKVKYGFVCVDILSAVCSGIQTPNQYYQRKKNTDDLSFMQEYLNIFLGTNENSLFKFEDFDKNQILECPFYPRNTYEVAEGKPNSYKFSDDWVRFVSCDIALATGNENDASIFVLGCVNPRTEERKIEYIIPKEGLNTLKQTVIMKRLFYEYKATYCIQDVKGVGQGVYDLLTVETYDDEYGLYYPAWTVCKDKILQISSDTVMNDKIARTIEDNAEEVLIPFAGTAELNSQMHLGLRKALRDGNISLLKDEYEMEHRIEDKDPTFVTKNSEEKAEILMPFVQTRLMINEAISLESKMTEQGLIKVAEASRSDRKDAYMTLAMANLLADKIIQKHNTEGEDEEINYDDWNFLSGDYNGYSFDDF